MNRDDFKIDKTKKLHAKAETKVKNKFVKLQKQSASDKDKLLHELEAHQIELEMQNEELRRTQTKLEESRQKYSDLYDFAPVGYLTFDKKGIVTEVNLTGSQMLRTEKVGLIKKPFNNFISKDSQDAFYLHCRQVFDTKVKQSCEVVLVRKDGGTFDAQLESVVAYDSENNLTLCRTTITDITERKQVEEELRQSEENARERAEQLNATMNAAPAIILTALDSQCRRITGNKAAYEFLRVKDGDDLSKTGSAPEKLNHYHIFKDGQELMPENMPVQRTAKSGKELKNYAMDFAFDDGTICSVLGNVTPLFDSNGQPAGAVAVFVDITVRKQAEQLLRQSEHRLRLALQAGRSGAWEWNILKRETWLSPEMYDLLGIKPDTKLHLENLLPIVDERDREHVRKVVIECIKNHACPQCEFRINHSDKGRRWIECFGNIIYDDNGKAIHITGISQDITQRKNYEQQIKILARFPEENPSQVLRVSDRGEILYSNKAGKILLAMWNCKVGEKLPENWQKLVLTALKSNRAIAEEIKCGENIFSFIITPIPGEEYVNLYGRDITSLKKAEEQLRSTNEELENRVKQRTKELTDTIGMLKDEIEHREIAELKLEKRTRDLNAFFSNIITPLVILDKKFNFIRVNKAYADSCRKEILEFEGHNHFEFYPHEENQRIFKEVVKSKKPYQAFAKPFEYLGQPEWGTTYWDWILVPVLDKNGEVEMLVFSLQNVTERKLAEDKIRTERQRLIDILEFLPAYVILLTEDHHVPFANKIFRERFGDSGGKKCFEYLFGRTEPCEDCQTYKVLETMKPGEWEWKGPDGRDYHVFDYPFIDTDETKVILEMGIDVTEQKNYEKELRTRSLYVRSLIEANLDPLVTIDSEGKITDANVATEEATGISRKQLTGSDFSDYFTEPDKAKEAYTRVISEGFIKDYPLTIHHTSGRLIKVLYNATVYRNEKGEVQGVFAAARDITEIERQQQDLEKTRLRLVEAQRIAHLGNWEWNVEDNKLWWSQEVYRIFGFKSEKFELSYENFMNLVHPGDRVLVKESIEQSVSQCKPSDIEYRIIKPNGQERIIHSMAEIKCDQENKPIRMTGTVQDVTEAKKVESQIIRSQLKLRTLAAKLELAEEKERRRIAGDLHDSIGQLLAFSTRELKYLQKSAPKNLVAPIQEITEQLDKAVQQTRTLSFDLSPGILYDIGFEVAVEDMVEKFSKERKINCEFENSHHSKPLDTPVKVLLYRSVRELLINVAKHSHAKNARVILNRAGNDIYVTVEDDGRGFDTEAEKAKGFGIFNVRERLEHIGGKFKIESVRGKGTKATLTAPLTIDEGIRK